MSKEHYGQHDDDCFGCKIQTIQVHPNAIPSRTHYKHPPRTPNPSWERGIPVDGRGMPTLMPGTTVPMGQKMFSEKRTEIEAARRRNHQAPSTPE